MIDYTLSQLHSLAEAAKISINILDKFKVSGVAVPDGLHMHVLRHHFLTILVITR